MTGRTIGISLGVLLAALIAAVTYKILSATHGPNGGAGSGVSTTTAKATTVSDVASSPEVTTADGSVHPALRVVDQYLSSTHRLPPTLGANPGSAAASEAERQVFQATLRDARMNAAWTCLQSTGDLDAEIDGTQDDPLSYSLTLAAATSTTAKVNVVERFGEETRVSFDVAAIDGRWLITATSAFDPSTIDCTLEPPGPDADDL